MNSAQLKKGIAIAMTGWLLLGQPAAVLAQEAVDAVGTSTGPTEATGTPVETGTSSEESGAPACTGASCTQGMDQGFDQGLNQGGPSAEDIGAVEGQPLTSEQAAQVQGGTQGTSNGITAVNSDTGASSSNSNDANASQSTTNSVNNTAVDTTNASATGTTGGNNQNMNTASNGITTGNAGIGVTQVKNDNTATIGGTAGLTVSGYNGDQTGDLTLDFGSATASLLSNLLNGGSIQAINDTTGADSSNSSTINTKTKEINEVQNDGRIDNILDLAAITGQNSASMNTGDGSITTGDADVAATLVNLLNTTVINGNLWVSVADIFGNLTGNIILPDLSQFASLFGLGGTTVDASNTGTGSDSTNTIDIAVRDTETTDITNDADINTTVNAKAITGQNEATSNTGGAEITTGDAQVESGNVTLANTTVEGGNWALVVVNALNGWFGFLLGDNGHVQALSQDETVQQIEAQNNQTGAGSDNTINVAVENERTTTVKNDAVINNEINVEAITGQNTASKNTGSGIIATGDAHIAANTVNIANTTVKDGSLFVAVVNVLGNWFGDLLFGGSSLLAGASSGAAVPVTITGENSQTGSDSTNTIDVDYDRERTTNIDNTATIDTTLNATVDTGGNKANKNTGGAQVKTGDGLLGLHARSLANLTAIADTTGGIAVEMTGENGTTGASSENRISANVNDERVITVNNEANVSTSIGTLKDPALVNTGGNEANQNTLGAEIVTGIIDVKAVIANMVNKVLLALVGQGVTVDADFTNKLTGALSTNLNELTAEQRAIIDIVNDGIIDNLINLLLITGDNEANDNTGPVAIATGVICVEGDIANSVNSVTGATVASNVDASVNAVNDTTGFESDNNNSVDAAAGTKTSVDNDATVNNTAHIDAMSGGNEASRNTGGAAAAGDTGECPIAVAPTPVPTPTPAPSPEVVATPTPVPPVGGGEEQPQGGGGEDHADEAQPRVAGAVGGPEAAKAKPTPLAKLLKRFPVAGGADSALWMNGAKRFPWVAILLGASGVLTLAWQADRRSARRQAAL